MKILCILFTVVHSEQIIKNINIPTCRNCVYYKPSYFSPDFTSSLNKCTKFGNKDIITNTISYNFADMCRKDETKCGKEGKYFELEKKMVLKIIKHQFINSLPNIILVSTMVLYVMANIYLNRL
jgi:hypothetical protein